MSNRTSYRRIFWISVTVLLAAASTGCAEVAKVLPGSTWHEKCGWKAEDYFDDPQVIALCKAIEANDLAKIDRLIASGADVNAKGKGNMTPLLWAFPDNKLERFERLLQHGANPNVLFKSDFGTRSAIMPGDSVTHMAAATSFPGYFEAVFENGGDPNLVSTSVLRSGTPLLTIIKGTAQDKKAKINLLVDRGADINHPSGTGTTPVRLAVGRGYFDLALMLLQIGADYESYRPNSNAKLVHAVANREPLSATWSAQQKEHYKELVKWLEDRGESMEKAKADLERWRSWNHTTGEYRRKMDDEIAARKAREARERRAAEENNPQDE